MVCCRLEVALRAALSCRRQRSGPGSRMRTWKGQGGEEEEVRNGVTQGYRNRGARGPYCVATCSC